MDLFNTAFITALSTSIGELVKDSYNVLKRTLQKRFGGNSNGKVAGKYSIILIITLIVLFTILMAYRTTFTSKKAEQHPKPTPPSNQTQLQNNIKVEQLKVEQRTEGDQSPAIKTDEGNVTLNYGDTK
jgi:flagellar basal body-associated protein FliL